MTDPRLGAEWGDEKSMICIGPFVGFYIGFVCFGSQFLCDLGSFVVSTSH